MYRLTLLFALLFCFGCVGEQPPAGFPPLVPCSLLITQEGQPLADASVSLFPVESDNKWSSGGMSDVQGRVQLYTHSKFAGVPVGKYKVVIQKRVTEGESGGAPIGASAQEFADFMQRRKANPPRTYDVVNTDFASPESTTLEISVEKKGKNLFPFDVGKAVRKEVKTKP